MRRVAVFLGLAAIGAAVAAEPPIGSRLGDRLERKQVEDQRDAAQAAHQLAGCILAKRGTAARDLLNSRNEEEVKKLNSRIGGEFTCFAVLPGNDFVEGVSVSYPPHIMRGNLAEELLKRNRSAVGQLEPVAIQKIYSRPWFALTGRHVSVDEMAACVADTNPAAIMTLVESEPFTDAENAAFGNLVPFMGPCLTAGTTLGAKREPLRAALAEALYQRVENPGESVAGAAQDVPTAPNE